MVQFLASHIEHTLFVVLLIGRLGDVISTRLVSPKLLLESNPIARRWRWPYIVASIGFCFVPYWSVELGIVLSVVSLWVSSDNISRLWLVRSVGEAEYAAFVRQAAARSTLGRALAMVVAKSFFIAVMGLLLCFLSYQFYPTWTFWFGIGILAYGANNLWMGLYRFLRRSKAADAD